MNVPLVELRSRDDDFLAHATALHNDDWTPMARRFEKVLSSTPADGGFIHFQLMCASSHARA